MNVQSKHFLRIMPACKGPKSLHFSTPLWFNSPTEGFPRDDLRKILSKGHSQMAKVVKGTKWRRNIAENFNRLSRVHERYKRHTEGRTTTYSEREGEFTFANSAVFLPHSVRLVYGAEMSPVIFVIPMFICGLFTSGLLCVRKFAK